LQSVGRSSLSSLYMSVMRCSTLARYAARRMASSRRDACEALHGCGGCTGGCVEGLW
jgi:hypothetical protein